MRRSMRLLIKSKMLEQETNSQNLVSCNKPAVDLNICKKHFSTEISSKKSNREINSKKGNNRSSKKQGRLKVYLKKRYPEDPAISRASRKPLPIGDSENTACVGGTKKSKSRSQDKDDTKEAVVVGARNVAKDIHRTDVKDVVELQEQNSSCSNFEDVANKTGPSSKNVKLEELPLGISLSREGSAQDTVISQTLAVSKKTYKTSADVCADTVAKTESVISEILTTSRTESETWIDRKTVNRTPQTPDVIENVIGSLKTENEQMMTKDMSKDKHEDFRNVKGGNIFIRSDRHKEDFTLQNAVTADISQCPLPQVDSSVEMLPLERNLCLKGQEAPNDYKILDLLDLSQKSFYDISVPDENTKPKCDEQSACLSGADVAPVNVDLNQQCHALYEDTDFLSTNAEQQRKDIFTHDREGVYGQSLQCDVSEEGRSAISDYLPDVVLPPADKQYGMEPGSPPDDVLTLDLLSGFSPEGNFCKTARSESLIATEATEDDVNLDSLLEQLENEKETFHDLCPTEISTTCVNDGDRVNSVKGDFNFQSQVFPISSDLNDTRNRTSHSPSHGKSHNVGHEVIMTPIVTQNSRDSGEKYNIKANKLQNENNTFPLNKFMADIYADMLVPQAPCNIVQQQQNITFSGYEDMFRKNEFPDVSLNRQSSSIPQSSNYECVKKHASCDTFVYQDISDISGESKVTRNSKEYPQHGGSGNYTGTRHVREQAPSTVSSDVDNSLFALYRNQASENQSDCSKDSTVSSYPCEGSLKGRSKAFGSNNEPFVKKEYIDCQSGNVCENSIPWDAKQNITSGTENKSLKDEHIPHNKIADEDCVHGSKKTSTSCNVTKVEVDEAETSRSFDKSVEHDYVVSNVQRGSQHNLKSILENCAPPTCAPEGNISLTDAGVIGNKMLSSAKNSADSRSHLKKLESDEERHTSRNMSEKYSYDCDGKVNFMTPTQSSMKRKEMTAIGCVSNDQRDILSECIRSLDLCESEEYPEEDHEGNSSHLGSNSSELKCFLNFTDPHMIPQTLQGGSIGSSGNQQHVLSNILYSSTAPMGPPHHFPVPFHNYSLARKEGRRDTCEVTYSTTRVYESLKERMNQVANYERNWKRDCFGLADRRSFRQPNFGTCSPQWTPSLYPGVRLDTADTGVIFTDHGFPLFTGSPKCTPTYHERTPQNLSEISKSSISERKKFMDYIGENCATSFESVNKQITEIGSTSKENVAAQYGPSRGAFVNDSRKAQNENYTHRDMCLEGTLKEECTNRLQEVREKSVVSGRSNAERGNDIMAVASDKKGECFEDRTLQGGEKDDTSSLIGQIDTTIEKLVTSGENNNGESSPKENLVEGLEWTSENMAVLRADTEENVEALDPPAVIFESDGNIEERYLPNIADLLRSTPPYYNLTSPDHLYYLHRVALKRLKESGEMVLSTTVKCSKIRKSSKCDKKQDTSQVPEAQTLTTDDCNKNTNSNCSDQQETQESSSKGTAKSEPRCSERFKVPHPPASSLPTRKLQKRGRTPSPETKTEEEKPVKREMLQSSQAASPEGQAPTMGYLPPTTLPPALHHEAWALSSENIFRYRLPVAPCVPTSPGIFPPYLRSPTLRPNSVACSTDIFGRISAMPVMPPHVPGIRNIRFPNPQRVPSPSNVRTDQSHETNETKQKRKNLEEVVESIKNVKKRK